MPAKHVQLMSLTCSEFQKAQRRQRAIKPAYPPGQTRIIRAERLLGPRNSPLSAVQLHKIDMRRTIALMAGLVVATTLMVFAGQASAQGEWRLGRATFYGKDGWSIHNGACGYGYLDEVAGTGWDVAAAADANWDFKSSCGKCKEVRCKKTDFTDGYGQKLDRSNICFDPDASVVITIVDACPCSYPGNWYSNKRWCCGDMYHMDLSIWAFEKLTDLKWGVMALEWRDVPCWYKPNKPAKNPWGSRQGADMSPPWKWHPTQDKRPYNALDWNLRGSGRRLRGTGRQ